MPDLDSIWKASDGRLLRVVTNEGGKIGVRNVETNRLSYMHRRYFENREAAVSWWLEPHTTPLLESATKVAAVDPVAAATDSVDHARSQLTDSELVAPASRRDAAKPPMRENASDVLMAPCRWCAYNGPGYWQEGTHAASCPWRKIGGEVARLDVMRDHPEECKPILPSPRDATETT